jgi:hypothetical protein
VRIRAILGGALLVSLAFPFIVLAADAPQQNATLSGSQEVPPVNTTAKGSGWVNISADDSQIVYHLEYSGLSGAATASHIHTGATGVSGGVILPLTVGPSPMNGTLTAADFKASGPITTYAQAVAAIKAGDTYFNIHTAANPGGEIRGQIEAAPPATSTKDEASGTNVGLLALVFAVSLVTIVAGIARRTQRRHQ